MEKTSTLTAVKQTTHDDKQMTNSLDLNFVYRNYLCGFNIFGCEWSVLTTQS